MSRKRDWAALLEQAEELGCADAIVELVERAIDSFEDADAHFSDLHWGDESTMVDVGDVAEVAAGDSIAVLGVLEVVEYYGAKGGSDAIWVHPFEDSKPLLGVAADGRLVIVGGDYTVTEAGIVG